MANWSPAHGHASPPRRGVELTTALDREHEDRALKAKAIAAAIVAATVGLTFVAINRSDPANEQPGEPLTYIVQTGDTEWRLANIIAPDVDPRKKVDEIDRMLPDDFAHAGRTLQPGDTITYRDGKIIGYLASGANDS